MFEYVNPETNERQSLHSFIVERIIDRCLNDDIEIRLSDNDLRDILNGGYYGMSLLKTKLNSDIYEDIYYAVFNEDNELRDGITIKPYVCDFLKAGQFPLIITTSCYPILENKIKPFLIVGIKRLDIQVNKCVRKIVLPKECPSSSQEESF